MSEIGPLMILAMLRLSPLFLSPAMGIFPRMPISIRMVLLSILSFLMAAGYKGKIDIDDSIIYAYMCLTEFMFGMVFLLAISIVFGALDFTGRMIDSHSGISVSSIFNPLADSASGIIANMLYVLLAIIFWITDTHLQMIKIIQLSTNIFPLGGLNVYIHPESCFAYVNGVFVFVILLFSPVFAALLCIDILMGIMARIMPQMNVYFVSLPLKIISSFIVIAWTLQSAAAQIVTLSSRAVEFILRL